MGAHEQTGLAGCFSVDEYDQDVIRKHERTRKDKEDDRTRHMFELRAQTGPVFLTYPASSAVDAVAARVAGATPLFDFTARRTACSTRSGVWLKPRRGRWSRRSARFPLLYIADGHHRAASAMRARQELRAREHAASPVEADTFLGRRVSRVTRRRSCHTIAS